MIAPNVEQIEGAADQLKTLTPFIHDAQLAELTSFGAERAKDIGASGLSDDFKCGYELGLQTARAVISGSVALMLKGVDPKDVL